MTPEERDIIVNFIARVSGAQTPGGIGSVPPALAASTLPSIDPEADALIADQFNRNPEARYRLAQLAFVQEHALAEAQNRLKRMEWELQQAQQAHQTVAQPQQPRGFLGALFGGASAPPPPQSPQGVWGQGGNQAPANYPPPLPQYAPGYQEGMFQRPGSGFLGSALTTAAGVAGGMVIGNALMDMFSPRREAGSGMFGGATPIENAAASPWAGGSTLPEPPVSPQAGYVDQSSWSTPDQTAQTDGSSWVQPQPDPSSWADNGDGGGNWATDNGGGSDDDNGFS